MKEKDKDTLITILTFGAITMLTVLVFLMSQRIDVLMDKLDLLEQRNALIEQLFLSGQ